MWLALKMGFQSCANPFMLASVLLYVSILSFVRHTRLQLIISGLLYICMVWLVNFFVLYGVYDSILYLDGISTVINYTYSILIVLFISIGCLHFGDWFNFKHNRDRQMFLIRSPRSLDYSLRTKRLRHFILILLICYLVAYLLTILEARLSQNYFLFVNIQTLIKQDGTFKRAYLAFLTYMLSYSSALIVIWFIYLIDGFSLRFKSLLNRFIALEKLFYAALYWAVAAGLIFYLINVVRF